MNTKNNTHLTRNSSEHNYGIDSLRILAMLMIVILHTLGCGGILETVNPMSAQYEAAWFLEIAAYCAVNCYALISGYVGINAKYKYQNIIMLWLKVVFYTLSLTLLFSIIIPDAVSPKDWLKALLPVTSGYYWYFSAYFALFFFIPVLNIAMNKITQKQYLSVVIGLILVFSCLQTLFAKEIFGTSSNAWWLMILYIIGGYVRKYGLFPRSSSIKILGIYFIIITLTWLSKFIIESGVFPLIQALGGNYFIHNTSFAVLSSAICLLLAFERIGFSQKMIKVIQFFSPMTFSVYLIHANYFSWNYFLSQRFTWQAKLPVPLEILSILFTAIIIYIVCSLIDLIRTAIFRRLKIKKHLDRIEDKYLGDVWNS